MTDKERLVEIIDKFVGHEGNYPMGLADAILAAGFGDVEEEEHCKDCCCARAWKALEITEYTGRSIVEEILILKLHITEKDKRIVELEAIAQRAGDVEGLNRFMPYDAIEPCSDWLLNGEGKDGG